MGDPILPVSDVYESGTVALAQCLSVVPGLIFWFIMAVSSIAAFLKNYSRRGKLKNYVRKGEGASVSLTICIPAYLPGEGFPLLDTIHYCLNKVQYGCGFQLVVAYNTPHAIDDLEDALWELDGRITSTNNSVRILKVAGSTSKAENVNAALKIANGKHFVIYDADHHPDPDSLLTLSACMVLENKRAPCHCIYGSTYPRRPFSSPIALMTYAEFFAVYFTALPAAQLVSGRTFFMGSNGLWLTKSLHELGGFTPGTLTEDIDLSFRAHLKGYNIKFCPESRSSEEPQLSIRTLWIQRMRWLLGWSQTWRQHKAAIFKEGIQASFMFTYFFFVYGTPLLICYDILAVAGGRFLIPMAYSALSLPYIPHSATAPLFGTSACFQMLFYSVSIAQVVRMEGVRNLGKFSGAALLPPYTLFTAAYHIVAVKRSLALEYGKWIPTMRSDTEEAETLSLMWATKWSTDTNRNIIRQVSPERTPEVEVSEPGSPSWGVSWKHRIWGQLRLDMDTV